MDGHPPPTRQFTGDTAQVTGAGAVTPRGVRKVQAGVGSKGGKTRSPQHINCKGKRKERERETAMEGAPVNSEIWQTYQLRVCDLV